MNEVCFEGENSAYRNCSKIYTSRSVLNRRLVIRTGIHKMLVRITNRVEPDQTASAVWSGSELSSFFWQAASVLSFRTFTIQVNKIEREIPSYCWTSVVIVMVRLLFLFHCLFLVKLFINSSLFKLK